MGGGAFSERRLGCERLDLGVQRSKALNMAVINSIESVTEGLIGWMSADQI